MGFSPILEREMSKERDIERKAWVCVFFRVNGVTHRVGEEGMGEGRMARSGFSIFSLDSKVVVFLFVFFSMAKPHVVEPFAATGLVQFEGVGGAQSLGPLEELKNQQLLVCL
ncbi:hypothetical protein DVH24_035949 [Malus domestica]|uniref:Uncharacterized protein n=1 Tax=Malus domestica TaxID=3750 RepID=A0A498JVP7_MALDO|nr:hypothetical protein DVH24_035949 [Malus domestica]